MRDFILELIKIEYDLMNDEYIMLICGIQVMPELATWIATVLKIEEVHS